MPSKTRVWRFVGPQQRCWARKPSKGRVEVCAVSCDRLEVWQGSIGGSANNRVCWEAHQRVTRSAALTGSGIMVQTKGHGDEGVKRLRPYARVRLGLSMRSRMEGFWAKKALVGLGCLDLKGLELQGRAGGGL